MSFLSKQHEIKGKTAVITGGNKNLGAATAKELARLNANLFIHYHSDDPKIDTLKKELLDLGSAKVEFYQSSLDSAKSLTSLFAAAKKAFPDTGIDIAINNVGQVLKKPIVKIEESEFDQSDLNNNKVAFFFIKEAALNLNQGGRIVSLVTSLLAAYTPFYSVYQGTKSGVEYYTKAASKELVDKRISVNAVAPGPMDTPFLYGQETDGDIEFYKSVALDKRLTKIEDIVPIIRFLVTEGGWISGQTIYASGGFTAH